MQLKTLLNQLESKIPFLLKIAKIVLYASAAMSVLTVLFVVISYVNYSWAFVDANWFNHLHLAVGYATFYVIFFGSFPASVAVILLYFLYRFRYRSTLKVNIHFRLMLLNVVILLAFYLLVVFVFYRT